MKYALKNQILIILDAYCAHYKNEVIDHVKKYNSLHIVIIHGNFTSKLQPLNSCINKPFKDVIKKY